MLIVGWDKIHFKGLTLTGNNLQFFLNFKPGPEERQIGYALDIPPIYDVSA